ncbi:GGDEF domain-containing protein [Pseudomonas sp. ZM23]|uniref:diguanylate cyclase n=1 Tax=Pseudomonas triclosanedens TaxID=2961893 RepID=A0ABY7A366_9PSED|nr:GGDEF domain-containing protein [Pseudomonas triclosanedens]MCP8464817.1 GGDEF domain-containing protein [Pseudomonas triclosanedens]MCP8470470.1 GGDEF domain-containing protein [Pseudomonas triclosanedens]MCP8476276.1 GGDEF domain-containing protein [Pseudomonas triclosanedens]WAI51494.1 GGDEF domain-containing protein [Pseudomonas triclosanedens]
MFKTIESEVLKQRISNELRTEFLQHDFERLHSFSMLVLYVSICMWFLLDLIVSFQAGQGFSYISVLYLAVFAALAALAALTRKARHFYVINLLFVITFGLGARMVIEGLPNSLRPAWLVIAASTVLYSATAMPLSRPAFFSVLAVTWVLLNPLLGDVPDFDERRSLLVCYPLFISALSVYIFHHLHNAKLYNYAMARLLLDQAYLDALTGIPNRRSFMTRVTRRLNEDTSTERYLAMVDIDHFKRVNDAYGHDIGDEVLTRVAQKIESELGEFEIARLGGEEFGIFLWGMTAEEAQVRMERLRSATAALPGKPAVTISLGLAHLTVDSTLSQMLIKADRALYDSKHNGRNRVTYAP